MLLLFDVAAAAAKLATFRDWRSVDEVATVTAAASAAAVATGNLRRWLGPTWATSCDAIRLALAAGAQNFELLRGRERELRTTCDLCRLSVCCAHQVDGQTCTFVLFLLHLLLVRRLATLLLRLAHCLLQIPPDRYWVQVELAYATGRCNWRAYVTVQYGSI